MPEQQLEDVEIPPNAGHENPEWVNLSSDEVEELIVKMARDGMQTAEIGVVLRDQYAVPDVKAATGKTLTQVLEDNDAAPDVPEDLANLIRRAMNLRDHLREHPKDTHNMRGLQIVESRIRRLVKYYKRQQELPYDWKYSERNAKLLVE